MKYRGCSFPGCHHRRFVDAHHVRHWSDGGETSVDKLMLLCSRHHRLVHEGGYEIRKDLQGQWYFKRPDGRAIPATGYHPADMRDEDASAESQPRLHHPSAEGFDSHRRASAEGLLPPPIRRAALTNKQGPPTHATQP